MNKPLVKQIKSSKEIKPSKESLFLASAQKASDLRPGKENYHVKAFLAGASGSGKTLSSITLPGNKLVIDFDGRSETLAGLPNISIEKCVEPDPKSAGAWRKAQAIRKQILAEVKAGVFPYDSVIFDGVTMLRRYCLNWALTLDPKHGLGGSPARQHYLPEMENTSQYILSTLALKLNILYTGHLDLIEDESTGKLTYLPKVTGKLRTEFPNWFNECFYTYRVFDTKKKKTRYFWQTSGTGTKEFFKSTLNSQNKYWENPVEINLDSPPCGFEDLLNRRFPESKNLTTT